MKPVHVALLVLAAVCAFWVHWIAVGIAPRVFRMHPNPDLITKCRVGTSLPTVYTTSASNTPPEHIRAWAAQDGGNHIHIGDTILYSTIHSLCGEAYANATLCFIPGAFKADALRACILYAKGGLYLDTDIHPLIPLRTLAKDHLCTHGVSITADYPSPSISGLKWIEAMQFSFVAAEPGHPLFECHMDAIVENAQKRAKHESAVLYTGPALLMECFKKLPIRDRITVRTRFVDTGIPTWHIVPVHDRWGAPIAIQRRGKDIAPGPNHYLKLVSQGQVYNKSCSLYARCPQIVTA